MRKESTNYATWLLLLLLIQYFRKFELLGILQKNPTIYFHWHVQSEFFVLFDYTSFECTTPKYCLCCTIHSVFFCFIFRMPVVPDVLPFACALRRGISGAQECTHTHAHISDRLYRHVEYSILKIRTIWLRAMCGF